MNRFVSDEIPSKENRISDSDGTKGDERGLQPPLGTEKTAMKLPFVGPCLRGKPPLNLKEENFI